MANIMKGLLQKDYETEYSVLKELFGASFVDERTERLNIIHEYTESLWREYIKKIPDQTVKYLLIAESPPWSDDKVPQYFLDPNSRSRSLMNAFKRAFFPDSNDSDLKFVIARFAEIGLLLIDSIPFSMNYDRKRRKDKYKKLVRLTVHSYMLKKLSGYGLKYTKDMKIVFGYQLNALNVIDALGGILKVQNNQYVVNKEMICTNAANYPDANSIRKICHLTIG